MGQIPPLWMIVDKWKRLWVTPRAGRFVFWPIG
jgi:hypothetical protein